MNKILAISMLIVSTAVFPVATPSLAGMAVAANDALCGPGAPEGYKRPGGYCDQLDNKGSLIEQEECDPYLIEMHSALERGETLLVAEYCWTDIKKL